MKVSISVDALTSLLLTVGMLLLAGVGEVLLTGWEFTASDLLLFSVLSSAGLLGMFFADSTPRVRGVSAGLLYFFGLQIIWYLFSVAGLIALSAPSTSDLVMGILFGFVLLALAKQIDDWSAAARKIERYKVN